MANPITAAKGQINIILEPLYPNQGMQTLMNTVPAAATMSLTNQPVTSAVQGARLVVWVMSGPTSGGTPTITIVGKDINGNALTEGPFNVFPFAVPQAQSAVVGKFEYESIGIFGSVNASGVTTTGLAGTGATISIFAVQAAKFLVPGVLKSKKKPEKYSPNEHRNLLDKDTKKLQTKNVVTIDELSQVLYPENSIWIAYMLTGSTPTVTTLPLVNTVLKTGATTSPFSLTTQPFAPGQQLQFVVTGAGNNITAIAIAGTNQAGGASNETIVTAGNGTYTSVNFYSAINTNGITITGSSYSIVVTGLNGPTNLKAVYAVAGGATSLTTQPTAPGEVIQFCTTAVGASGTISVSGTNQYGQATSETITVPNVASANYYTSNVYSAIAASGISFTGLTGGSVTINGMFGWTYTFLPGDVVYSATLEKYTGVDSFSLPWSMFSELTWEFGMDKEVKVTAKGIAQDRLLIGDRTASYLSANRVTAIGQPLDLPMVGWQSLVYIDAFGGTFPTTTFGDVLDGKITLKSPQEPRWTSTNSQNFNRVNRGKRETTFEAKLDLTNVLQLEQHRQNYLQYITFQFLGQPIGGGNNKTWQFTFPVRWDDFDMTSTPDMSYVEATVIATAEYDATLGGSYSLKIVCQQAPNYTS